MMKDERDMATGELLTSRAASRQAAYKDRKREAGFKQKTIWIRAADYRAGTIAAELGSTNASQCPEQYDRLSWTLGYCEALERMNGRRK